MQPVCGFVNTGVDKLPKQIRASEIDFASNANYRNLKALGYVSFSKVKVANPLGGGMIDGVEIALTPKGNAAFGKERDDKRCYGQWKARVVKDFTVPSSMNGITFSKATVLGEQSYVGWARDEMLRKVFNLPPLPATATRTVSLVLKNTGWAVTGVSK